MHRDGFVTKKFVTMHGHMNVKFSEKCLRLVTDSQFWASGKVCI